MLHKLFITLIKIIANEQIISFKKLNGVWSVTFKQNLIYTSIYLNFNSKLLHNKL